MGWSSPAGAAAAARRQAHRRSARLPIPTEPPPQPPLESPLRGHPPVSAWASGTSLDLDGHQVHPASPHAASGGVADLADLDLDSIKTPAHRYAPPLEQGAVQPKQYIPQYNPQYSQQELRRTASPSQSMRAAASPPSGTPVGPGLMLLPSSAAAPLPLAWPGTWPSGLPALVSELGTIGTAIADMGKAVGQLTWRMDGLAAAVISSELRANAGVGTQGTGMGDATSAKPPHPISIPHGVGSHPPLQTDAAISPDHPSLGGGWGDQSPDLAGSPTRLPPGSTLAQSAAVSSAATSADAQHQLLLAEVRKQVSFVMDDPGLGLKCWFHGGGEEDKERLK